MTAGAEAPASIRVHRLRQPEIEQLRRRCPGAPRAARRQHHVARLEIAVDDAVLVRGVEGLGDLRRDAERLRERQGAPPQALGERLARKVLHHEVVDRG